MKENNLVTNWPTTDTVVQESCPEERVQDHVRWGRAGQGGGAGSPESPSLGFAHRESFNLSERAELHGVGEGRSKKQVPRSWLCDVI